MTLAAGVSAVVSASTDAGAVGVPTLTVSKMASGGYVTAVQYPNGDSMQVYASTPVAVSDGTPTSDTIVQNGRTVTEQSVDGSITLTGNTAKSTFTGSKVTAYDELIAMGVSPDEAAPFKTMDTAITPNSGGGVPISKPVCITRTYDGGHLHLHGCDTTYRVVT